MRNFHVPLPDHLYAGLRAEADRARQPATALARRAIDAWLKQKRKAARHNAIAVFAAEHAGTPLDIDSRLEAASADHLLEHDREEY